MHRLIHRYDLAQESALRAIAIPPIFNSIFLLYDCVMFWWHFKAIKDEYPECHNLSLFTQFVKRNNGVYRTRNNTDGGGTRQPDDDVYHAEEREHLAFMGRARALVLEESKQDSTVLKRSRDARGLELDSLAEKVERILDMQQLQAQGASDPSKLKEKLRKAKELFDEGLIDETVYKQEQVAILDKYR